MAPRMRAFLLQRLLDLISLYQIMLITFWTESFIVISSRGVEASTSSGIIKPESIEASLISNAKPVPKNLSRPKRNISSFKPNIPKMNGRAMTKTVAAAAGSYLHLVPSYILQTSQKMIVVEAMMSFMIL